MSLSEQPHRRFNPLKNQWILVSPHRAQRPWQEQHDTPDNAVRPKHDPDCYLCARNARAGAADVQAAIVAEYRTVDGNVPMIMGERPGHGVAIL